MPAKYLLDLEHFILYTGFPPQIRAEDYKAWAKGCAEVTQLLEGLRPHPTISQAAMDKLHAEMMAGVQMAEEEIQEELEEELRAEDLGLCTCGLGNDFKVGHSDWCDYKPTLDLPEDTSHGQYTWNPKRGVHGSWTCGRCSYEAFRLNDHTTAVAPMPPCPGKKP